MNERLALSVIGLVSAGAVAAVAVLLLGRQPAPGGTVDVSALPALNAVLNATSAGLLTVGYVFIRRRQVAAHLACMLGAFGVSTLFLTSYVILHYYAGSRPFAGEAWMRSPRWPGRAWQMKCRRAPRSRSTAASVRPRITWPLPSVVEASARQAMRGLLTPAASP